MKPEIFFSISMLSSLYRKLKATIEEYTTRVGQQAVVLCCTPGKSAQNYNSFKVFGSQPLEGVVSIKKTFFLSSLKILPIFDASE